MTEPKPCPFCGSRNLAKYRFNIGGFLDKDVRTEAICGKGDTFRIECDCGCRFDKHQDDLYTRLEMAYGYDVEVTDDDLWNRLIADWNRRAFEYHDDADLLTWVNTWLDSARFDRNLTEEEQDACWVVLSAVARLQEEEE